MERVEIEDSDDLYRRLVADHVKDGEVSYLAYRLPKNPDSRMSVDLAKLTTPAAAAARATKPGRGVGALVARVPRELEYQVFHDPVEGNPAHSAIEGDCESRVKLLRLARATRVVITPQ